MDVEDIGILTATSGVSYNNVKYFEWLISEENKCSENGRQH